MAVRNFSAGSFTPTATGDGTNLANATYMGIQGTASTQRISIQEVMITGESTTSAPTFMTLARDSQLSATPTALAAPASDGPQDPANSALSSGPLTFTANTAGNLPQRSNSTTLSRMRFSFNALGGIVKWNPWAPNMAFVILGNAASNGEASLSAYTGGTVGQVSAHILYETA